jgi:hypothetical protein
VIRLIASPRSSLPEQRQHRRARIFSASSRPETCLISTDTPAFAKARAMLGISIGHRT